MGRTACTEPQCLYKGALYLTWCDLSQVFNVPSHAKPLPRSKSYCWISNNILYSTVSACCSVICNSYTHIHTGCPRSNVPDFGRVFLMLKYTDITQNTYIQSWMVTEIMTREKCGLRAIPRTAPVQLTRYVYTAHVLETGMLIPKCAVSKVKSVLQYYWIFICHIKCLEP